MPPNTGVLRSQKIADVVQDEFCERTAWQKRQSSKGNPEPNFSRGSKLEAVWPKVGFRALKLALWDFEVQFLWCTFEVLEVFEIHKLTPNFSKFLRSTNLLQT